MLVGFANSGYILWHPQTNKFLCSKHVRCNEKLTYKDVFKDQPIIHNLTRSPSEISEKSEDIEQINFNNNNSENQIESIDQNKIQTEKLNTKPKRKRKAELNPDELLKIQRKMPMRKAKEGRDFKIYAKNIETENYIIDTSFENIPIKIKDKSKIIFRDSYAEENEIMSPEDDEVKFCMLARINKDPTSIEEALASEDSSKWLKAIEE